MSQKLRTKRLTSTSVYIAFYNRLSNCISMSLAIFCAKRVSNFSPSLFIGNSFRPSQPHHMGRLAKIWALNEPMCAKNKLVKKYKMKDFTGSSLGNFQKHKFKMPKNTGVFVNFTPQTVNCKFEPTTSCNLKTCNVRHQYRTCKTAPSRRVYVHG